MAYRWFDPGAAWDELRSLLVHQFADGPDRGMIPHMSYLAENGDRVAQELFARKNSSFLTQPPLVSVAFLAVYRKAPRKDVLRAVYPKLLAYHDWFDRRRDPDHDSLVAIIHPWESGWDASQRWDGPMAAGVDGVRAIEARRRELAGLIGRHGCDAAVLSEFPGGFYVKPVDFNAIRAADLDALSMIASELGEVAESGQLVRRANEVRKAIRDRMVDGTGEVIKAHDLLGKAGTQSTVDHAGKFILLFGRCLRGDSARSLALELTDPLSGYATPYPVPSVPVTDPSFDGNEYWRGNVWLSINWLIREGLRNYGMAAEARRLAERSLDLVARSGFREFFNPLTGEGGTKYGRPCPRNYGWSTIVLDMMLSADSFDDPPDME
jgi:glycogen debranching enzyme